MTSGMLPMLKWPADNLDSPPWELWLQTLPSLARELILSCWMMSGVLVQNPDLSTASSLLLTTASILKMPESDAKIVSTL